MNNETKTIKAGDTLTARSPCDSECIFEVLVLKRGGSFVTVQNGSDEPRRVKVQLDYRGEEVVYALGRYSMAPCFRVKAIAEAQ